ncbi:MAG: CHAT domain-containing protein [Acidobacteria bacterium]|nr:CHAT domain-containing protein [Acidobacteriota bacterium]
MSNPIPTEPQEELLGRLAGLEEEAARQAFLRQHPQLQHQAVVLRLTDEVAKAARENIERAERLAQVANWLTEILQDDFCRARCARAMGHLLVLKGKYPEALASYQKALDLFSRLEQETETGITLSSSLQPLIYLGRYPEAFERAQKAREVFKRQGDRLRLARLDANLANILHRQDRFEDALVLYQRAQQALESFGEHRDVAIVLSNMAVCCISLYDFASALDAYQKARAYCERHNMPLLVAQADYNIAYLYYLRGEYVRAIELYRATRTFCDRVGDAYHRALCDLDQAEIYLELNLAEEGGQLAQQAFASFESLGMGYEAAKALAFLGIAAHQERKPFRALEFFAKARERFAREQNWVWPALLDLYQALVLYHEGRAYEARRSGDAARDFFSHSSLAGKATLAELLRSALHLAAGELTMARYRCDAALARIERSNTPALGYLAHFVLGQVQEAQEDVPAAYESYRRSVQILDGLPSQRPAEDLKIPFLKNKLSIYEALVATSLRLPLDQWSPEDLFAAIEKAKSRQLADLIAFRAHALPAPSGTRSGLVEQVKSLREELNWYYRQIDLEELRQAESSTENVERLRQRTREHEAHLLKSLGELRATDEEFLSLQNAGTIPLETVRQVLPPDTVMVEYFQARETIYACVLDASRLYLTPLTPASRVGNLLRLLQSQFSKFRLGAEYARAFAGPMREAALQHLHELYQELIAPVREQLAARHLILVPHGVLHYLPFHAFFDGARFLVEDFAISYSSSASLFYLCVVKKSAAEDRALVLGIPDRASPQAAEEARAVAAVLPKARLVLGAEANEEALRAHGPGSRHVHLATQGTFRQDNPLFSSLRLGNSQMSLFDLYHLRLPCELVTLSGCGPGLTSAGNGEELSGLVRGLLYAGAESVLNSLWNVPEASTVEFLGIFYRYLKGEPNKAVAHQQAMLELRQTYPNPYHWAPFVLNGKVCST